jgi:hypothetical protein
VVRRKQEIFFPAGAVESRFLTSRINVPLSNPTNVGRGVACAPAALSAAAIATKAFVARSCMTPTDFIDPRNRHPVFRIPVSFLSL